MSIERSISGETLVPQRLIVEIGCGNFPFPVQGSRRLKPNERYIGIDSRHEKTWGDHNPIEDAIKNLTRSNPPQEGIFDVIEWDGRMVQLPDGSVDEVHMQNLMGDKNFLMTRLALLTEGARILKKSGVLRVVDDDTPYLTPPSLLREMLKPIGLVQLNEGQEQDLEALAMYSSNGLKYCSLAFIAEFGFMDTGDKLPDNIILFRSRR